MSKNESTVIVDAVRSPMGVKKGKMVGLRADELAAQVVRKLLDRQPGALSLAEEDRFVADLHRLVPFAVVGMLLVLILAVRSIALVGVAFLHSIALLIIVLGGMAVCGLSVNLVSVLAPVLMVPIGVADLLHLLVRLRSGAEAEAESMDRVRILDRTFTRLEGPIVATSVTTAIGFLGFLISPIAAIRQFYQLHAS